ncbi:MAG: hypothetical protein HOQ22_11510 [Nocardioidaceae bacterium]|nr:hypothetical protein [Nocardioidaceae bacterium]NUS51651.1 hypothetical protein [Nocardioidaceae bacterium]
MTIWTPRQGQPFLDASFPLPLDRPFTRQHALASGITPWVLRHLVDVGLVRRLVRGVYVAAQVVDSVPMRARALSLVVPRTAVVTDWTACWFWTGIDAPGAHERAPELYVFHRNPHTRLHNGLSIGGARSFSPGDLVVVEGVSLTSPLRTACDIGRLFHRDRAIGAIDALLRHGTFDLDHLVLEVERFKGMRGVRQLRALAPLADARAESPGESTLRLRWLDEYTLPAPTPQVPIIVDGVEVYRIDLGVPELRYGCEYDGALHHGPGQKAKDRARLKDLFERFGWDVEPARRRNVFGPTRDVEEMLHDGVRRNRLRAGLRAWPYDAA